MIRLGTTFEEYLAQQFSKETSRKLRQEGRQLEKACGKPLVFQAVTERAEIPAYLTKVERLSASSWQGKHLGSVVRNTETEREHLGALANQGWLLCYLLSAGDDPLAFLIGYHADGIYYADRTGYDLRWARRGPGKAIWYKTLDTYIAEGICAGWTSTTMTGSTSSFLLTPATRRPAFSSFGKPCGPEWLLSTR
jgi:Acetyltransferase (GNAT) domain